MLKGMLINTIQTYQAAHVRSMNTTPPFLTITVGCLQSIKSKFPLGKLLLDRSTNLYTTISIPAKVDEKTVQTIKRQIREEKKVNVLEVISNYPCKRLKYGHELAILSIGELARKINSAPVVQPSILRTRKRKFT